MPRQLMLRPLTSEEQEQLTKLSRSRTAAQHLVERAQIILAVQAGSRRAAIAQQMGRDPDTITRQVQRFNRLGVAGLQDEARSGRPLVYSESERGAMIAAARTHPQSLGQPFGHWSLSSVWVFGALEPQTGAVLTTSTLKRNSPAFVQFLEQVVATWPRGDLVLILDNLSTHKTLDVRLWALAYPRVRFLF